MGCDGPPHYPYTTAQPPGGGEGVPLFTQVRQILFEIDTPPATWLKYAHPSPPLHAEGGGGGGVIEGTKTVKFKKKLKGGRG